MAYRVNDGGSGGDCRYIYIYIYEEKKEEKIIIKIDIATQKFCGWMDEL